MGMALQQTGGTMQDKYEAMPIARLREIAKASHDQHDPEAPRAFVNRVLDMEVERRTWYAHENPGFQPFSATAKLGESPGGSTAAADPLAIAYDRGIRAHSAHEQARQFLVGAKVTPRNLLAALIQAAKTDRRVTGPWGKSFDQIATNLGPYAQRLGFSPGVMHRARLMCYDLTEQEGSGRPCVVETPHKVPLFKDGKAIRNAAREGRVMLILLAQM